MLSTNYKLMAAILALVVLGVLVWWGMENSAPAASEGESGTVSTPSPFTPSVVEHAIPESEVEGARLRVFNVKLEPVGVTPSAITVRKGDEIQFNLSAGWASDFVVEIPRYELYVSTIPVGKVLPVSFSVPMSGTFTFGCRQRCPGDARLTAQLIVLDR